MIMEALALRRPVISTAIAGIPELVDESCGWLIPAGSEEALVEAMEAALRASAKDLSAKGAVGRERVLAMHDATRNARLADRGSVGAPYLYSMIRNFRGGGSSNSARCRARARICCRE